MRKTPRRHPSPFILAQSETFKRRSFAKLPLGARVAGFGVLFAVEREELGRSDAASFQISRQNDLRGDGVELRFALLRFEVSVAEPRFRFPARKAFVDVIDRDAGRLREFIAELDRLTSSWSGR